MFNFPSISSPTPPASSTPFPQHQNFPVMPGYSFFPQQSPSSAFPGSSFFPNPMVNSAGSFSSVFNMIETACASQNNFPPQKRQFQSDFNLEVPAKRQNLEKCKSVPKKLSPINSDCQRTLNIGYSYNFGRKTFSCFIGDCRFKAHSSDNFLQHLSYLHSDHRNVLHGFCMICENYDCGSSIFDEFMHLCEHSQCSGTEKVGSVKQKEIYVKKEEECSIIDEVEAKIDEAADHSQFQLDSTQITPMEPKEVPVPVKNERMDIKEELIDTIEIGFEEGDGNEEFEAKAARNSQYQAVPGTKTKNSAISSNFQSVPTSTPVELSVKSLADSSALPQRLRSNSPGFTQFPALPIPFPSFSPISKSVTISTAKTAVPVSQQSVPVAEGSVLEGTGTYLEEMLVLVAEKSVPTAKSNSAQKSQISAEKSVPVAVKSLPTPENQLPTTKKSVPAQKRAVPVSSESSKPKIPSNPVRKLSVQLDLVPGPKSPATPSVPVESNSNFLKSQSATSSTKENSQTFPSLPKPSKRPMRKRAQSTFVSSNKKQHQKVPEELDETACLEFISKKIIASKSSQKVDKFKPNSSIMELLEEPTSLSNATIENLLETIIKSLEEEAVNKHVKEQPKNDEKSKESITFDKSESANTSASSIQLEPTKSNGFDLSQHSAYKVDIEELMKKSSSRFEFVSIKELYPWIDGTVTEPIFKIKSAIAAHLEELSLFSTYKCMNELCCFFTIDLEDFKKHVKSHDSINNLCCYCLKSFDKYADLCNHLDVAHKFDRFQCSKCMYRSCQKGYVDIHQKIHHADELMDCQVLKSPVQKLMKSDRMKCLQVLKWNREKFVFPYRCKTPRCRESFYSKDNFRKHLESESKSLMCRDFIKLICQQLELIDHTKISSRTEGVYQCLHCQYGTDNADIITHMAENHPHEFAYICKRVKPQKLIELNILSGRETVENATCIEYVGSTVTEAKCYEGDLENLKSKDFENNVTKKQQIVTIDD